jgi:protein TonB
VPKEMFGDVGNPSVRVGTKQWYTIPLSLLAHMVGIIALIVIPLLASDMIPTPQSVLAFAAMPPAPPPPPPPPPPPAAPPTPQPIVDVNPTAAPLEPPKEIKPEPPPPPTLTSVGQIGGVPGGVPGGVVSNTLTIAAPPPPPPPQEPVRAGGAVQEPKLLKRVEPVYPRIAILGKMEGMVIIDATIGKDGVVKDAKVLRPVPLFEKEALEAVKQWRYTPTQLNGVPVEVLLIVTVHFKLK